MLGDRLRKMRTERGMSQEDLAVRLNVVRQTVSKWEKGLSVPDADMLIKIAEVFGVTASEMLEEDNALKRGKVIKETENRGKSILKTVAKVIFLIFICYLIFLIVQAVFGLGVSVNTDISENVVQID